MIHTGWWFGGPHKERRQPNHAPLVLKPRAGATVSERRTVPQVGLDSDYLVPWTSPCPASGCRLWPSSLEGDAKRQCSARLRRRVAVRRAEAKACTCLRRRGFWNRGAQLGEPVATVALLLIIGGGWSVDVSVPSWGYSGGIFTCIFFLNSALVWAICSLLGWVF
jgi:hypothetical protein